MADVMSHGGDGAGDPSQQLSHRLALGLRSPRQGDGVSLEASTLRWFGRLTGRCHFLSLVECTMQPIRNTVKYFTCLVENQMRFTVHPCYPSWTEVSEEQRARLRSIIESYFDLQGDRSPDEYREVCAAVDRLVTNRYRDYKLKAHNHLKAHGPSRPYGEMSAED
ncbi:hypothetical protein Adt_14489 [Abeliophyllum distichum]|uniref:Uncharacterized protein n=1 Tax=Abeliophyllum distichum TaxID=126358 RepID=A0ABD1TZT1_9LAMI